MTSIRREIFISCAPSEVLTHLAGLETGYRPRSVPTNLPASSSYDIK